MSGSSSSSVSVDNNFDSSIDEIEAVTEARVESRTDAAIAATLDLGVSSTDHPEAPIETEGGDLDTDAAIAATIEAFAIDINDTPVVVGEPIADNGEHHTTLSRSDVAYLSCFGCVALLLLPLTIMLIIFVCAYGAERLVYDLEMWASFEKPTKRKRRKVAEKMDATSWDEEKHPPKCEICLTEFTREDRVSQSTNDECQHVFHEECIVRWLAMKYHKNPSCPVCRRTYVQTIR